MGGEFPTGVVLVLIGAVISAIIYVIPSAVAFRRNHPNRWLIFAINIAFGATVIGWLIALVWAFNAAHRSNQADGSHGGESGLNIFINDAKRVRLIKRKKSAASMESVSNPSTAIAELERLGQLHRDHHLTDDEYGKLKAAVLRRV